MSPSRGRPTGRTSQGAETRARLYAAATELMAEQGYEATTLRAIAQRAGVSTGLLYNYFPSKGAVVMALYDDLSTRFQERTVDLPDAGWPERFRVALAGSLQTLRPHRRVLAGALSVLLVDRDIGLFSVEGRSARERVEGVFLRAVIEAHDAPRLAEPLGRVLYVLQLGVLLWLIVDRSPDQRATDGLIDLLAGGGSLFKAALWVPGVPHMITSFDALIRQGLYGDPKDSSPA